jgi:hypothetical protein
LAEHGVNIESIDAEGVERLGVINLVVRDCDSALRVLRNAGFKAVASDALVVRLPDRPGALAELAARLGDARINLRSMHIMERRGEYALVSIVTEDNVRAADVLRDVLVHE